MTNPPNTSAGSEGERSLDMLLGGRVRLWQPTDGLRAAIDPVFMAAFVPARAGECVLEVGCGTGAAALCLAIRVADVKIVGLDVQADLIALAHENGVLNGLGDRVSFAAGDLLRPPDAIAAIFFDHVMANPPFARAGSGRVSPDPSKALASVEGAADLAAWVAFCAGRVRAGGSVTFVHRADRGTEVAAAFVAAGLDTIVLPLGDKRVLVRGNKTGGGAVQYVQGLVLHEADGSFTQDADAILRDGQALLLARE